MAGPRPPPREVEHLGPYASEASGSDIIKYSRVITMTTLVVCMADQRGPEKITASAWYSTWYGREKRDRRARGIRWGRGAAACPSCVCARARARVGWG